MIDRAGIVQLVRSFVGLSAKHDPEGDLARLVDFPGGDPPEVEVKIKTNCAMFVCGIWRELGCDDLLLYHQYVNGQALIWALEIARNRKASFLPHDGHYPHIGDVLHYATPPVPGEKPKNDDHLTFVVNGPDERRRVLCAGGGAGGNLITESDKWQSLLVDKYGRRLRHFIDTQLVVG
jgi:hypothetical protein